MALPALADIPSGSLSYDRDRICGTGWIPRYAVGSRSVALDLHSGQFGARRLLGSIPFKAHALVCIHVHAGRRGWDIARPNGCCNVGHR